MSTPEGYFALLGLTPAFDLDLQTLEASYFKAQRLYHPDRFIGKPPAERNAALQRSVDVNEAYQALKSPLTRAQTLLAMHGVIVGGDRDTVKPSQALLMETLEWRESIDEAATPDAMENTAQRLFAAHSHCLSQISGLYAESNWPEMAQATLRLGYLEKSLEAIAQKKRVLERK